MEPSGKTPPSRIRNFYIQRLRRQQDVFRAHRRLPWRTLAALAAGMGLLILWGEKYLRPPSVKETPPAVSSAASASSLTLPVNAPAAKPVPPKPAGPIPVQWKGFYCGITEFRIEVVRTEADWRELWKLLGQSGPAPAVDFTESMVAGVFLGDRPVGDEVTLLESVEHAKTITIPFRITRPRPGAAMGWGGPSPVRPYMLEALPRTEKRVRFHRVSAE